MRIFNIALVLVLMTCGHRAFAAETLSFDEFRTRFMSYLEAMEAVAEVEPDAETDVIMTTPEGGELRINVGNMYAEYAAEPELIDTLFAKFARTALAALSGPLEVDRGRLVIIIRPAAMLQDPQVGVSPDKFIHRPLAGDLVEVLAVDDAETIAYVSQAALERSGLTRDEAWALGKANIRPRLGAINLVQFTGYSDKLIGIGTDTGLAPSLLADAPCGSGRLFEDKVVLVLNKEIIAIGDADDKASMRDFWKMTNRLLAESMSLSQTPIHCSGGTWSVATPPR